VKIWCYIEVKHVSDIFQSLEYDILRRIIVNNLFVKLEKYIWKIREVGFLKVVIGLDKIKIEKKKVQEVVN